MMADPAAARNATHMIGFKVSGGLLRRCHGSETQGDIALPLVGPLDVVAVAGVLVQNPVQSTIAEGNGDHIAKVAATAADQ